MLVRSFALSAKNISHTMIEQLAKRTTLPGSPTRYQISISASGIFCSKTYACVPSTASNVWYRNNPTAQLAYTHGGQS